MENISYMDNEATVTGLTYTSDLDEQARPATASDAPKMTAEGVSVFYNDKQALDNVSIDIFSQQITALIGPSGCGKTTFLRCLNRMNDVIDKCRVTGRITLDREDIYAPKIDVVSLRKQVVTNLHGFPILFIIHESEIRAGWLRRNFAKYPSAFCEAGIS